MDIEEMEYVSVYLKERYSGLRRLLFVHWSSGGVHRYSLYNPFALKNIPLIKKDGGFQLRRTRLGRTISSTLEMTPIEDVNWSDLLKIIRAKNWRGRPHIYKILTHIIHEKLNAAPANST